MNERRRRWLTSSLCGKWLAHEKERYGETPEILKEEAERKKALAERAASHTPYFEHVPPDPVKDGSEPLLPDALSLV